MTSLRRSRLAPHHCRTWNGWAVIVVERGRQTVCYRENTHHRALQMQSRLSEAVRWLTLPKTTTIDLMSRLEMTSCTTLHPSSIHGQLIQGRGHNLEVRIRRNLTVAELSTSLIRHPDADQVCNRAERRDGDVTTLRRHAQLRTHMTRRYCWAPHTFNAAPSKGYCLAILVRVLINFIAFSRFGRLRCGLTFYAFVVRTPSRMFLYVQYITDSCYSNLNVIACISQLLFFVNRKLD